jgi:hypothetical protein
MNECKHEGERETSLRILPCANMETALIFAISERDMKSMEQIERKERGNSLRIDDTIYEMHLWRKITNRFIG